jgi:hypothetical protein
MKTCSMQYTRTKTNLKLTNTSLFSHINCTDLFSMYIMMCIFFPMTVRVLQNNERGFPLIFTITVVEFMSCVRIFHSWIWTRHQQHCRWRAAKFRPMLGAYDIFRTGRDLYCETWPLCLRLIRRTKDRPI